MLERKQLDVTSQCNWILLREKPHVDQCSPLPPEETAPVSHGPTTESYCAALQKPGLDNNPALHRDQVAPGIGKGTPSLACTPAQLKEAF